MSEPRSFSESTGGGSEEAEATRVFHQSEWRIGTMTALHDWSGAVAIVGLILRAECATVPLVTGGIVEP